MATAEEVNDGLSAACVTAMHIQIALTSPSYGQESRGEWIHKAHKLYDDTQLLKVACIAHGLTNDHIIGLAFILGKLARCELDIPGLPNISEDDIVTMPI